MQSYQVSLVVTGRNISTLYLIYVELVNFSTKSKIQISVEIDRNPLIIIVY